MAKGKKTGGRQKGSVNKVTALSKTVIADLLAEYHSSGLMNKDFRDLEPKDRMAITEKMMQYVLPKMQSTSVDLSTSENKKTIEDTLAELANECDE